MCGQRFVMPVREVVQQLLAGESSGNIHTKILICHLVQREVDTCLAICESRKVRADEWHPLAAARMLLSCDYSRYSTSSSAGLVGGNQAIESCHRWSGFPVSSQLGPIFCTVVSSSKPGLNPTHGRFCQRSNRSVAQTSTVFGKNSPTSETRWSQTIAFEAAYTLSQTVSCQTCC